MEWDFREYCALAHIYSDWQYYRFMNVFISTWVLLAAGLVFALPMIHLRVKNHTSLEEEVM